MGNKESIVLIQDSVVYGVREGLKVGLLYFVWSGLVMQQIRGEKIRSLLVGIAFAFFVFLSVSLMDTGMVEKEFSYRLAGYVFFLLFFSASVVLLRFQDVNIAWNQGYWPVWAHLIVLFASFVFFAPDAIASAIYLRELAELEQSALGVYLSLGIGFIPVLMAVYLLTNRSAGRISGFFGLAQFLIFLVLLKLLLGGAAGFAESSLVPTVQRGVMKFVHDLIHQSFLYLLVPDHPMLKTSTWNFIGFFFGPDFSIALALCILLVPPVYYLYAIITAPVTYPDSADTGADRRLVRAEVRHQRIRRMVPIAVFILIVTMSWYTSGSEKAMSLYVPEPKPLIEDKGMVIIPLSTPGADLTDGKIHKFSLLVDGKGVRLLLVRKPDSSLAVTLDACEICPADGYGQRGEHVVCIYCRTPIPLETLGKPGGCNPIPLVVSITDRDVRIQMAEISNKWKLLVNSRPGGEK